MLHKKLSCMKILSKTDIWNLLKCKLTTTVIIPFLITHSLTHSAYSFNRIWDLHSLSF